MLVALLLAAIVIWQTNTYPRTDDAEVLANFIGMAPIVNGPITGVDIRDNQLVHAGDALLRIDDRPYKYALQRAVSQQAQLEGQIYDESLEALLEERRAGGAGGRARRAGQCRCRDRNRRGAEGRHWRCAGSAGPCPGRVRLLAQ